MPARVLIILTAIAAFLAFAGCTKEKEGSGAQASETRDVGSFREISLNGEADVVVTIGEDPVVTVRGDDNLLSDVNTEVSGGTLEISQTDDVDLEPQRGITVEITVPELEAAEVSGVGNITMEGLQGELFRAAVSGAGNVAATGNVERVEAEISGAGDLDFSDLVAEIATIEISGAGDVRIYASESLDASVTGAGDIIYLGDPPDVQTDVTGAGDVRPE